MSLRLKKVALATAAMGMVFQAAPAFAQSSTLDRLRSLEAELAALKASMAATENSVIQIKKVTKAVENGTLAKSGSAGNKGFQVGNTTLKFGGFVDLDLHLTTTSDNEIPEGALSGAGNDQFIPSLTQVGDGTSNTGDLQFDATLGSSRLTFGSSTPTAGGDVKTHVELDFLLPPGGNEIISNSFNPRLRRAYVDYKGWRIGQEWSTFQGLHAIPESASFYTPAESQVFIRQPIIRYTNGNFQVALENPQSFIDIAGGNSNQNEGALPDIVARYNMKGDWGILSLSGLARQLKFEDATAAVDESTFGWGLSAAGRIKVGAKDDIRFTVNGGEGIGRYIGLGIVNGASIDVANEELDAIGAISGNIAYRHVMGPWSANVGVSYLDVDGTTSLSKTTEAYSGYVALLRKVAPGMTMGVEYLRGERVIGSLDANGDNIDGNINRFTFSTKKSF